MTFDEKLDWFCTGALDALATILDLEFYSDVAETSQNSRRVFCRSFLTEFEPQLDALAALETAFDISGENRNRYISFGIEFITVWQGHESRHRFVYPGRETRAGNLLHGLADSVFDVVRNARRQKKNIQGTVGGDEDHPFVVYRIPGWPEEHNRDTYLQELNREPAGNFVSS
jgi:hypothetical protein